MPEKFKVSGNVATVDEPYSWGMNIFDVMKDMYEKSKEGFTVIASLNGVLVIMVKEAEFGV